MASPKRSNKKGWSPDYLLSNVPPPPFSDEDVKATQAYLARLEAMPSDPLVDSQIAEAKRDLAEWPARRAYLAGGKTNSAKKNPDPQST